MLLNLGLPHFRGPRYCLIKPNEEVHDKGTFCRRLREDEVVKTHETNAVA
jgi:hypothetical protein